MRADHTGRARPKRRSRFFRHFLKRNARKHIQTLESKWPTGTCIEMFPDYIWENALEILFGRISQKRTQAVTVVVPTHIRIGDTA